MNKLLLSLQETAPITLLILKPRNIVTFNLSIYFFIKSIILVENRKYDETKIFISVVVVVALVGRELYESSKTNESKCPFCLLVIPITVVRRIANGNEWQTGRCSKNPQSSKKMIGYEYTVKLAKDQTCCSLFMERYENPYVIWVWCSKLELPITRAIW